MSFVGSSNNGSNSSKNKPLRHALLIGGLTFILAIVFSLLSQKTISQFNSIIVSIILLLFIILIGILADVVGTAATATSEVPFHSKAANKVPGAHHAIYLARKADKVANICNDVIGDIIGTLSGALGTAVVVQMLVFDWSVSQQIMNTLATGVIAALTVGGKAYGKRYAIEKADSVIFLVGRAWSALERTFHTNIVANSQKKNRKKDGKN